MPCDSGTAIIVSRLDRARDLRNKPLRFEAMGRRCRAAVAVPLPDLAAMAALHAALSMWERTDLISADVDVAELYDGFSFLTMSWLEALGFCGHGESGAFVEGGTRIARDGELPLNTNGGQLSGGRLHGFGFVHEACVQLRGDGGGRQVPKPVDVAVVGNGGGPVAGSMLLTRG